MPDPHRHTYDSRCGFMFIAGQPALLCRCHTWTVMLDGKMRAIPWEELPPAARWIVRRNQTRRHLLAFTIALALGLLLAFFEVPQAFLKLPHLPR